MGTCTNNSYKKSKGGKKSSEMARIIEISIFCRYVMKGYQTAHQTAPLLGARPTYLDIALARALTFKVPEKLHKR